MMKKLLVASLLFLIPCQAQAFERYNRVVKYDKYFSKYSKRYFGPSFDWRFFKAQAVAESRLVANVKSRAGALGQDRINFMFGSYNAGKGNIIKAQRIAKKEGLNSNLWKSIEPTLRRVTGRRSNETITYVKRINKIKGVLR